MLKIIKAPDPILNKKASPVEAVTPEIASLLDDMLACMYKEDGIGLAAPQIGVSKRILVMDALQGQEKTNPIKMVNPEIFWVGAENQTYEEGCLSFPEEYAKVTRPAMVHVRYLDEKGGEKTYEASGLEAVVIQHEIDHLDGINFVDHLTRLRRDLILKRMTKQKKKMAVNPS